MGVIAQMERRHRARKPHVCDWCRGEIAPGDVYTVGVDLPGSASVQVGWDEYEPVDWEFSAQKVCDTCYEKTMRY